MYEEILIATDGTETAGQAVARGVALAENLGAHVTLVSCGPLKLTNEVLDRTLAEYADSGVAMSAEAANGDPAGVILDTADAVGADLIVIGNKGMTGVHRALGMAYTPSRVAHHATCAVLIVKTT